MITALRKNGKGIEKAAGVYDALREVRPATREHLRNYLRVFLGIDVPDRRICSDHRSPMDYIWHCFSADFADSKALNADCIVWANRGGGKTQLAAAATLMDCLFKPGCQVRILGGSGEQSHRMYDYLLGFIGKGFEGFVKGTPLKGRCGFKNGSVVEVLTQSARSIRGQHIHKLRCDEIELFEPEVFAAAQFTTQSTNGLTAGMEVLSTMHRPYGLMSGVVSSAEKSGTPIFKWCLWEVIERCRDRSCSRCPLSEDCQGRAKEAEGYLKIDDCITQMRRSSRAGFEAEMLCRKPNLQNAVFDEFEPEVHVADVRYDENLPLYRALDFGYVNPFVCLWIQMDDSGRIRVIDEYQRSRATIGVHAEKLKEKTPCAEENVVATFCDPAGAGANDVTGTSPVRELRSLGIKTKYRKSGILEGIELIRRAVRAGDGKAALVISPRCERLIECMRCYHYPDGNAAGTELPVKDGVYDHHIDALRYFFVNYKRRMRVSCRLY